MRVKLLIAGVLLLSAAVSAAGAVTVTMTPAPKAVPCICPKAAQKTPTPRPAKAGAASRARRDLHRHAKPARYRYADAAPLRGCTWLGRGEVFPSASAAAPHDARADEEPGLRIEPYGWTGGVGYAAEGGGGYGGGLALANGGGVENGPTYNSYNQSFQFNPSQAGPFQPRLMGGLAPPSR